MNVYGARTIAGLAVDAIGKEIPELAKYIRQFDYVVAQDGSGDFFTVQEAINAVPDFRKEVRTTILVRKGTYKEKLIIPESKINISLIGEEGTVLTYDGFANKKNVFGENMGTSGSSSCYIYAPDFYAENITFENSSGPVGQAVACFVSADRAFLRTAVSSAFRILSIHTGSKAANITKIVTSKEQSILFSDGLPLFSIAATFIASATVMSLLPLPIKGKSMAMSSMIAN